MTALPSAVGIPTAEGLLSDEQTQKGGQDDDLGDAPFSLGEQHQGQNAHSQGPQGEGTAQGVVRQAQCDHHGEDDAQRRGTDPQHDILQDLAVLELLEENRGQGADGKGGHEHTQHGDDGAHDPGYPHTGEGGAVQADGAGGHFGNGHNVRDLGGGHPAVADHLVVDQRHHGHTPEAGIADLAEAPEELQQGFDHSAASFHLPIRSPAATPSRITTTQFTPKTRLSTQPPMHRA